MAKIGSTRHGIHVTIRIDQASLQRWHDEVLRVAMAVREFFEAEPAVIDDGTELDCRADDFAKTFRS